MSREAKKSGKDPWRLAPTYIPRLMPVGMIIILLAIFIPVLRERKPVDTGLPPVDPPLAMKRYETGYATSDSLLNEALRRFARKDFESAARILSKVHFYWSVQIREGRMKSYPEDLRFYLGLAELYRSRPDRAVPYLEAESAEHPFEEKYAWYLAHGYSALGDTLRMRETLERIVRMNDAQAPKAAEILETMKR